ncbi:MAG TPA: cytochrome c oxidase subunit II [Sphingobacteriaceae bacterium]|nr:cytochrome c oxidase subunit II [Sphingobacteriaceae bacterium]
MGLNKFFKIIPVFIAILTFALNVSVNGQTKDTAVAAAADAMRSNRALPAGATTSATAVDTAAQLPATATLIDTSVPAKPAEEAAEVDMAPVYKSAAYYTLLFLLGCIFISIVGRALKLYELSRGMQGKEARINWNRVQSILFAIILVLSLYGTYWTYDTYSHTVTSVAGTVHGAELDYMMWITIIITTIVFILTHIVLFGFSYQYGGSSTRKAYFYPHNNALEKLWTIIPAIVLTVLVLLGFFTWRNITNVPEAEQRGALKMEVVGEQFKWNIRYAGNDNQLGQRNFKLTNANNNLGIDFKDTKSWDDKLGGEIVLPVNKSVRVQIGSKDVLHSFYIPHFRVQINAVPGMPTYFQFTPRYTTAEMREKRNDPTFNYILLCAKICGAGHHNMQAKVTVVPQKEYDIWLANQQLYYNDEVKKEFQQAEQKKAAESKKMALNN